MKINMREIPKEYDLYQHFKGNLYQVIAVAIHTEIEEELVIYRDIFDTTKVYARPMDVFQSKTDKKKYPGVKQEYRFEKVIQAADDETLSSGDGIAEEEQADINPLLICFLEAETYEKKLDVLAGIREDVTVEMINNIAMSLDIELEKDSLQERYEEVKSCLITLEKYECNRLR